MGFCGYQMRWKWEQGHHHSPKRITGIKTSRARDSRTNSNNDLGGVKFLMKLEKYIRKKQEGRIAKVMDFIFHKTDWSYYIGIRLYT